MSPNSTISGQRLGPIADANGNPNRMFQNWINSVTNSVNTQGPIYMLSQFGAAGNGQDDTATFQAAVNQIVANGGGTLFIPPTTAGYHIGLVTIPAGSVPITLMGAGPATVIYRNQNISAGHGMIDVYASNFTLDSLLIDGQVTAPVGLLYNGGFSGPGGLNDPMSPVLTVNSLIWAHGPLTNLFLERVTFRHSSGYAPLIDAYTGGISYVTITNCAWVNCRPNLFGTAAADINYGSWTGCCYVNGDGTAVNGNVCSHFLMTGCSFNRCDGNCIWTHSYGFAQLHEDFRVIGNSFEDVALDGILMGAVIGGCVSDNVLHRVGYVTKTDTDNPVPKWLPNANATAIDSSGVVIGVSYQGNSITSFCGGGVDLDGHSDSSVSLNSLRIPLPGDPDYVTDSIAISGIGGGPSTSYGINMANSQATAQGATSVTITGNTILNMQAGSIRLYSARNCLVIGNNLVSPPAPLVPPISMGPQGAGPNQACTGNVIKHNRFAYSPAAAAPFVNEDSSYGAFTAAMANSVFGNCPIVGNGIATEFNPNSNSSSVHYLQTPWFT